MSFCIVAGRRRRFQPSARRILTLTVDGELFVAVHFQGHNICIKNLRLLFMYFTCYSNQCSLSHNVMFGQISTVWNMFQWRTQKFSLEGARLGGVWTGAPLPSGDGSGRGCARKKKFRWKWCISVTRNAPAYRFRDIRGQSTFISPKIDNLSLFLVSCLVTVTP